MRIIGYAAATFILLVAMGMLLWPDLSAWLTAHDKLAGWAQATAAILTLVIAFLVVFLQGEQQREQQRREKREEAAAYITLMASVAKSAHAEFSFWENQLLNLYEGQIPSFSKPTSLRHLDVAVEGIMFRDVGMPETNRLMIALRRYVAEVYFAVERAGATVSPAGHATVHVAFQEVRKLTASAKTVASHLNAHAVQRLG